MNYLFYLFVFTISYSAFAQIEQKPESFKQIHFIYEETPNITIDEKGIYADSLLMAHIFEGKKFTKATSPDDSLKVTSFLPLDKLSKANKNDLISFIYHSTHRINGTYNVNKNTTVLTSRRIDVNNISDKLKKYLKVHKSPFDSFTFKTTIDYNKKTQTIDYPKVSYNESFTSKKSNIEWINTEKTVGKYTKSTATLTYTNIVLVNSELEKHISPILPFENCESGIQIVKSYDNTTKLIYVNYE